VNINNFFVIDVGNTDIVVAIIQNFKIFKIKRFKTIVIKKKNFFLFKKFKEIKKILRVQKKIKCIISSVVPEINYNLKKTCIFFLKENPHFVSFNKTKLNINDADALFVSCTALPALEILDEVEKKISKPVFSSNQTLIWDTIRSAGYKPSVEGYGKLLRN